MIWWKLLKGFINDVNSIEQNIRFIKNHQVEMEAQMAATRVELNTKLNDLGTVLQTLLDKIANGQDFQTEVDVIQGMIDKINNTPA